MGVRLIAACCCLVVGLSCSSSADDEVGDEAASGLTGLLGSCAVENGLFANTCANLSSDPSQLETTAAACVTQTGGQWTQGVACTLVDALGTCTRTTETGTAELVFYAGVNGGATGSQAFCVSADGAWVLLETLWLSIDAGASLNLRDLALASYYTETATYGAATLPSGSLALMFASADAAAVLTVAGTEAGAYDLASGQASLRLALASGEIYTADQTNGSGQIVLSVAGDVAGLVEGTFAVTAHALEGGIATSTTVSIEGGFAVLRTQDDARIAASP